MQGDQVTQGMLFHRKEGTTVALENNCKLTAINQDSALKSMRLR